MVEFFVAPDARDADAGTDPRAPCSLDRALVAASGARATIRLRGGTYALSAPVRLTQAHSGLTLTAYGDERPVLSGGWTVAGWRPETLHGHPAWAAPVGPRTFEELWVNGSRRFRPRLPRHGVYRMAGSPDLDAATPWNQGQSRFTFSPGEVRAAWRNLQDVEAVALHFWVDSHLPLQAVDERSGIATTSRTSIFRLTDDSRGTGPRYYLDNVFEALTEPGDWYLDRNAGTLLYLPLPGEDPARTSVVAPVLTEILRIEGAEGVSLRGLAFAHAEWRLPPGGRGGTSQAAADVPAALTLRNARGCSVEGCTVAHCGTYGIEVAGGSTDTEIIGCRLTDLGAGGVKVAGGSARTRLSRCEIAACGRRFHAGVGVLIFDSAQNTVADCHIHDLYYTGVSVGWVWGYGPAEARENSIVRNHIHDIGQGMLNDMGGIYTLGVQPGTVLRGNHIHDVRSDGYGGWGIYPDEGSTGILIEDNLVYRTKTGGFHQHYGRDNVVRNNVFAFAAEGQIQRTRLEGHNSFTFEHNVVYFDGGPLLHGNWREPGARFDHNVYWDASGRPLDCGGRSFAQWQALGMDRHSLVADPRFADAATGDFTLLPDSPAPRVGFRPFAAGPDSPA